MEFRLPHWSRYLVTLALFGSGVLLSANIGPGHSAAPIDSRYSAVEPAEFQVSFAGGRARIQGHSASYDHEVRLARTAAGLFDEADVGLRPLVAPDAGWSVTTERLLHVIASSESATALLTADAVVVRAVVSNDERWQQNYRALASTLRPGITVHTDVIEVRRTPDDSCSRGYEFVRSQPVVFDRASAALRSSMHPVLDRHVEFALECMGHGIRITGHTDSRGDEQRNKALSLARAQAVADYLVARGVPVERVLATGAGSSRPIETNETAWGRVRNRRIEFELWETGPESL